MKKLIKILKVALISIGLTSTVQAGDLSNTITFGSLHHLVSSATGEHEGYDVDVAKLMLKILVLNTSRIKTNRVDLVISVIANPSEQKSINFSVPMRRFIQVLLHLQS